MRPATPTAVPPSDAADFIEELRLRSWARAHYVPAAVRDRSWHPIILDEMSLRDGELQEPKPAEWYVCGMVPLAPAAFARLDAKHDGPGSPKLLLVVETVDNQARARVR